MRRKSSSTSSAVGGPLLLLLPSSAAKQNKVYINGNTLTVTGEKAVISINHPRGEAGAAAAIGGRRHRIDIAAAAAREDTTTPATSSISETKREDVIPRKKEEEEAIIKLNKCVFSNDELFTRQVRKIRETVQTQDFERLLIGLTSSDVGGDIRHGRKCRRGGGGGHGAGAAITAINPAAFEHVYHNFFGVYYDILHQVVKNNKMSSIT